MERILALDVGNKRIGVAVSDALGVTAQGVKVVQRRSLQADLEAVCQLVQEYQAAQVVIGLPLNMNGSLGPQAELAQQFGQALTAVCPAEIVWQDERLTTAAAERTLLGGDVRRQKRKQVVDMLAAQMILETYLGRRKAAARFNRPESGEN
ncbi:MAG: Holliday junction resolvase RuvX [Bacillota bacterium]